MVFLQNFNGVCYNIRMLLGNALVVSDWYSLFLQYQKGCGVPKLFWVDNSFFMFSERDFITLER